MLNLESKVEITKETFDSPNLCEFLTDSDLKAIGEAVYDSYQIDDQSMEPWRRRMSAALDLATQIQKDKNFPWPGCSNITFPLITIAALQFHSRAYPAIIDGPDVVQCRVIGPDPDGSKSKQAEKIGSYMSWQLMEEDENWETDMDRTLLIVPIVGTCWKKTYPSGEHNHNVSELVLPQDLIINYWAKSAKDACKTHRLEFDRNKIYSRIVSGIFRDVREEEWFKGDAPIPGNTAAQEERNVRMGLNPPAQADSRTPFILLEQHCCLDLDGDGYAEPCIVTIEKDTRTVLRITYGFSRMEDVIRTEDNEIIRIIPTNYFTKIPFIPNPDGSILDIGFGVLLGPLNESVNSAINQLFDAGTMANTAGGFLGRGAKIRGGVYNFSPFEWNRVDSTGDDLRKSVIPLPVREPSNVMFQLLSLLINYTEKVSGAVDVATGGNPGQNTPSTTMQEMVTQGQKVYAAIFKRIWRALKQEFRKLYYFNGLYLPEAGISWAGSTETISRADFLGDGSGIIPVADPNVMSDQQRFMQANALMQIARGNPLYNQDSVNIRYLKALKIHDIETLYYGMEALMSGKAPPPRPTEKVQVEMLKAQVQMQQLQWKKLQYMSSLLEQRRLNEAKIIQLYAQAALAEEQAGGVKSANDIAAFQAKVDALKLLQDGINNQLSTLGDEGNEQNAGGTQQGAGGNVQGMEVPPGYGSAPPMGQ
jgi:chaperonin GroES